MVLELCEFTCIGVVDPVNAKELLGLHTGESSTARLEYCCGACGSAMV